MWTPAINSASKYTTAGSYSILIAERSHVQSICYAGKQIRRTPTLQPEPAPDSERAQQPAAPGTKYMPYAEKPASEPTYKPYAENPAPDEQPYEPYKDI